MTELTTGVFYENFSNEEVPDDALTTVQQLEVNAFRIEKRRREKALVYSMLNRILPDYRPLIGYNAYGAPHLIGLEERYLSISHCSRGVAVAISGIPTGVDAECQSPRLDRVKSKFLDSRELEIFDDGADGLLRAWTLMEAAYKTALTPELSFFEGIKIYPHAGFYHVEMCGKSYIGRVFFPEKDLCVAVVTP